MATQVQIRRGTATENDAFTGASGELTFDTTNKRVRVHDGSTAGGFELKTENAGGDTLFADGEKAIFGAGSDLQIYHDGANSYIQNVTNSLIIQNDSDDKQVIIKSDNGSGGVADYFRANGTTGEALLYHYGSPKLTPESGGVNITGTLTSDGLTVDGAIAFNSTATFSDGSESRFGADNDMALFHSGGVNHIRVNSGIFKLRADDMRFTAQNGTSNK